MSYPSSRASTATAVDVAVAANVVPHTLDQPHATGPLWSSNGSQLLLTIPRVGRYLVTDGRSVAVDAEPQADPRDVRLYLLGTILGSVLHQRRVTPLHASAIEVDGRAVLFVGASGAGKSTIAAWLAGRGYPLIADEIVAVGFDASGVAVARPGPVRLRLWDDAVLALGLRADVLTRDDSRTDKFQLVPDTSASASTPVTHVVGLWPRHSPAIELMDVRGRQRLETVLHNLYRPQLGQALGSTAACFQTVSVVARLCRVARLGRPRDLTRLNEVVGHLERWWGN